LALERPLSPGSVVTPGDVLDVRIRAVASSGAGVADLPDGRVVFVHRTAPDDRATVRLTRLRTRWATARLERVCEPGASRVEPPCRLYEECGGCTLQHLDYPEQLAWKSRFLTDALQRIGKVSVSAPTVAPSPATLRYRNRVTFTLRRHGDGSVVAGFHGLGEPDDLVDVHGECLLPEAPILSAWRGLRSHWGVGAGALPGGNELKITLRSTDDGVVLFVKGGHGSWHAPGLLDAVPELVSVWHQPFGAKTAQLAVGSQAFDGWMGERHPVAGRAFLQVNREAAEGMSERVLAQAPAEAGTCVDGYCGAGVFGRALAQHGWSVTGVELEPEATAAARARAPAGFRVVQGRMEERLEELLPVELVILNPPRTGVHERVAEALTRRPPRRIVYLSCDPATLARDIARLGPGYRITHLEAFDLFPQTAHVETLAVLDHASESG
jgi:23S rRNA (uracil1939-C5)-methyltransferase